MHIFFRRYLFTPVGNKSREDGSILQFAAALPALPDQPLEAEVLHHVVGGFAGIIPLLDEQTSCKSINMIN